MRELISFNNSQKVDLKEKTYNTITFSYQSPNRQNKQEKTPKKKVFNEPMNPADLY